MPIERDFTPYLAREDATHRAVAIASEITPDAIGAADPRAAQKLTLVRADGEPLELDLTPRNWSLTLTLPVTSLSFHPVEPVLAIGMGSYDGGWSFVGDLLYWNWSSGENWRPFLRIPEVIDVHFDPDGDRAHLLVRPWDETCEPNDEWSDVEAWTIAYRAVAHFPGVRPPVEFKLQSEWRLREDDDPWLREFAVARNAAREALAAWMKTQS